MSMKTLIVFYDIPSKLPDKAWSPNTWKTRYALNYKGIPYKTVWLEYPQIEPVSRELGAAPTSNKPDGRPHYTLPMIHDPRTGAVVSDSAKIAAYLDKTYPDTPPVLPASTAGFYRVFEDAALPLLAPLILNPVSEEYFRRTREETFGKKLEELVPKGDAHTEAWQKVKDTFAKLDGWIRANGEDSKYIMGDTLCFADIWMASYVLWISMVRPDLWKEVKLWNGGRWERLLKDTEKYQTVA
ncbi:hypothetical protein B0H10DRAFT_2065911 [Mycena sp. CBHHK59/15]|nr:hypothetical protein B0H10DRAFT_2065911 [Mycena sp. CBHHK59/15]